MICFLALRRFLLCLLSLLCLLKIDAQETPVSNAGGNLELRSALEQEAFLLVNQYRKNNKLAPLAWSKSIADVARGHSRDMADGEVDFGHDGFSGRVRQLKTQIVGVKGCGENVLKTDDPNQVAEKAVALWLRSPVHLHNIRGDYNYSGMGVWEDKRGMIYFTQVFAKIEPRATSQTASTSQVEPPLGLLASPQTRSGR